MPFNYQRLGLVHLEAILVAAKQHARSAGQRAEFEFNGRCFTVDATSDLPQLWCDYWSTTTGVVGPANRKNAGARAQVDQRVQVGWTSLERARANQTLNRLQQAS